MPPAPAPPPPATPALRQRQSNCENILYPILRLAFVKFFAPPLLPTTTPKKGRPSRLLHTSSRSLTHKRRQRNS